MESQRMDRMDFISNLPEELLSLILMKLPVKDLIHLLSVSKLFKYIITRSEFVYHHNKVHATTTTTRSYFLSISQTHHSLSSGWLRVWKYKTTPFKLSANFDLLGSSAGVVCLLDFDEDNFQVIPILWNPFINRFKLVPAFKQINNNNRVLLGFGFDDVNNDYKVVMILYKNYSNELDAQALVYGTKTGSWRTLHQTTVPCFLGFNCHAEGVITKTTTTTTSVNGVVYWPARKSPTSVHCDCIMGFDVVHEVFNVVELPDHQDYQPDQQIELCTSPDQNFLAMFASPNNNNRSLNRRWNVWFMCDNTWQKQYSMELKCGITPLEILKNGQILARQRKDVHVLDLTGHKKKEIKNISACRLWTPIVTYYTYTPSLALLDHDSTAGCILELDSVVVPCRKRPRFDY